MEDSDKRFIEARLLTPEAKIYLSLLGVGPSIAAVKRAISYLPHTDQINFARGLAGTKRYRLLLP